MSLKLGILAIGSLFWDSSPARQEWRQTLSDEQLLVTAPIRYGRQSSSRGYTYTMVFSSSAEPGQARVLTAAPTNSADDLIAQAESLWTAETNGKNATHAISTDWGCVVLLTNPTKHIPEPFVNAWNDRVHKERSNYANFTVVHGDLNLIDDRGLLNISWPVLLNGQPLTFDLLLATANYPFRPTSPRPYPNVNEIADAWIARPEYANYFVCNREHGIFTFQDKEIAELLGLSKIKDQV